MVPASLTQAITQVARPPRKVASEPRPSQHQESPIPGQPPPGNERPGIRNNCGSGQRQHGAPSPDQAAGRPSPSQLHRLGPSLRPHQAPEARPMRAVSPSNPARTAWDSGFHPKPRPPRWSVRPRRAQTTCPNMQRVRRRRGVGAERPISLSIRKMSLGIHFFGLPRSGISDLALLRSR